MAAHGFTPPAARVSDSGMNRRARTAAVTVKTTGTRNRPRQPSTSANGPARTVPRPLPMAMIEASAPIAEGSRWAGKASRTMPNASGNIAPPTPWMTRAPMSTPMVGASAATTEPSATASSASTKMRRLPTMSPTRPSSGVATAAEISQAVMVQVAPDVVVPRSRWITGSTGTTRDCRVANEPTLSARMANVRAGWSRDIEIFPFSKDVPSRYRL